LKKKVHFKAHYHSSCYYYSWSNFQIFLWASERRFQCTKGYNNWILYAKVTKEQSLVQKEILPYRYILDFWRCIESEDSSLGLVALEVLDLW